MKVLEINSVCGIRSTGRICTDIAEVLQENGHKCIVAYGREAAPEKYKDISYRIGSDTDVKMHALKARFFDSAGFGSKKATERLIEKIKEYDPDIIHLHNIHGYYLNIDILFNYLAVADKPVVWTLHDCWSFTGHCAHFDYADCKKWICGCNNCPQKHGYPQSLLFDNSKTNWNMKKEIFNRLNNLTIVTPSKWLADLVSNSYLNKYSIKVINNGIDIGTFKYRDSNFKKKYKIEDKRVVLGVASVWDKRKGFEDFLKLAGLLNNNYVIVLVGLNEEQLKRIPKNIIGIKSTDSTQMLAEIYSAADVFFNPTYEDNYPTVNLEAQACKTPVITYNTGGSPESVIKNAIVEKGNLTDAVKLIEKSNLLDVLAVPEKNTQYEKYINLYKDILNL